VTQSAIEPVEEPDARRTQILRAALDVIADRGYPDTRIADVAERIDISPALVMYYYKTKDRLLAEATRYAEDLWYEEGTKRMKAIDSAAGRLEELVRLTCLPQTGPGLADTWSVWLDLWAQALRQAEIRQVREEFDEHWRETIRQIVRDGQAAAEFAPVDVDAFAESFSALLDGFAVQIALADPVMGVERCFDLAMRYAAGQLGFPWAPDPATIRPAAATERVPDQPAKKARSKKARR
jgi:AcrR family transcriptional regulator